MNGVSRFDKSVLRVCSPRYRLLDEFCWRFVDDRLKMNSEGLL